MTQREKELTQQVERLTNMVNALVQELAEAKAEIYRAETGSDQYARRTL